MKQLYFLVLTLFISSSTFAQVDVEACINENEEVELTFYSVLNCPTAPGSLAGLAEIGFHSGINGWSTVVAWDDANAATAVNDGNDVFSLTINPAAYYGPPLSTISDLNFVFNQGPFDAAAPWDSEGKRDDMNDGCIDFILNVADMPACTLGTNTDQIEMEYNFSISPNPLTESAILYIDGALNQQHDVIISSVTGQVIRQMTANSNKQITIDRNNLQSGLYFITIVNDKGERGTRRLMVQ